MIQITSRGENPYADILERALATSWPAISAGMGPGAQLELVSSALIGTKQWRYGPMPSPESLVSIRKTIRWAMDAEEPIPILVPWGSMKPDVHASIDIAEVMALRALECAHDRVRGFYPPGLNIRVRIEDLSGWWLFRGIEGAQQAQLDYVHDLMNLMHLLDSSVTPTLESDWGSASEFNPLAEEITLALKAYIIETDRFGMADYASRDSYRRLQALGWVGEIPPTMREHYRNRYRLLYHAGEEAATTFLAEYLAQTLAKRKLHMLGTQGWSDFIQATFVPPIPGAPPGFVDKRIYMRVLPESIARTHIAPWRARGYLRVSDGERTASPALASWGDQTVLEPATLELSNYGTTVSVSTPYVVI